MPQSSLSRILLTLAFIAVAGGLSVASSPAGTHIGYMWPVGLVTGVFLLGTRRQQLPLGLVLLAVVLGTFLVGDYPGRVAVAFSVVTVAEGWLVQQLLPRRADGRAWLLRHVEFVSYALAGVVGAVLGGTGFALVSATTGFGIPWEVGTAALITHLASQLILVPLFLKVPPMVLQQGRREQVLRWLLAVGVTLGAVIPTHLPALVFLVMPVLAWTAVRAPIREIEYQLLTVAVLTSMTASLGYGPFDHFVSHDYLSAELARIPQQAFLLSCVLVSIPFALAVRQQRESQREAATLRSRSDTMVNSAHGLVIIGTDDLGRINTFNPGAERVLAYRADEVFGESPEIFHTDEELARLANVLGCRAGFFSVVAAYLEQSSGRPMDWEFVRKDGGKRILSFALSPVNDENGVVVGFIATADDVTERVEVRQALEASLRTAVDAEQQAVRRLTEVDRAKDSFVSAVSHELRTPITSLLGYLEMLQDGSYGELSPAQYAALDRIALNSGRLLTLIDDVLTLSRIEDLDLHIVPTPTDLGAIVSSVGAELRHLGEVRHLVIDVRVPDEPVVVPGDQAQLTRMVTNLADNAAKFTPDGGRVTLRLDREEGRCTLTVQDTGVGIPRDEQDQVFERFFRSRAADADALPGTGIGLFLAKAIAEAHGASIQVRSQEGAGTTFEVVFVCTRVAPVPS